LDDVLPTTKHRKGGNRTDHGRYRKEHQYEYGLKRVAQSGGVEWWLRHGKKEKTGSNW